MNAIQYTKQELERIKSELNNMKQNRADEMDKNTDNENALTDEMIRHHASFAHVLSEIITKLK
jgi:hypothetical protein